jgi:hypothetical protein
VSVRVPNDAVAWRGDGRMEIGAKANPQTKMNPLRLLFLIGFCIRLTQVNLSVNPYKNMLIL